MLEVGLILNEDKKICEALKTVRARGDVDDQRISAPSRCTARHAEASKKGKIVRERNRSAKREHAAEEANPSS